MSELVQISKSLRPQFDFWTMIDLSTNNGGLINSLFQLVNPQLLPFSFVMSSALNAECLHIRCATCYTILSTPLQWHCVLVWDRNYHKLIMCDIVITTLCSCVRSSLPHHQELFLGVCKKINIPKQISSLSPKKIGGTALPFVMASRLLQHFNWGKLFEMYTFKKTLVIIQVDIWPTHTQYFLYYWNLSKFV